MKLSKELWAIIVKDFIIPEVQRILAALLPEKKRPTEEELLAHFLDQADAISAASDAYLARTAPGTTTNPAGYSTPA